VSIWPESEGVEGRAEIYLQWKQLAMIALMILLPLIIALFFKSLIIKIICWGIFLLAYTSSLRFQGPCATALAVGAVPWYIYLELDFSPIWLLIVAIIITSIEISYIRHRMRHIKMLREKEGIIL